MFRELLRKKQELSKKDCIAILTNEKRGVLSLIGDDGYPYGLPIDHYYDPEDGKLYFHCGKVGHKIDAINRCNKASYCVIDQGVKDPDNWYLHFNSVIVFGKISFIQDEQIIADKARKLSYKFTDDDAHIDAEIAKSLKGTAMFALDIEHICGKHIKEE